MCQLTNSVNFQRKIENQKIFSPPPRSSSAPSPRASLCQTCTGQRSIDYDWERHWRQRNASTAPVAQKRYTRLGSRRKGCDRFLGNEDPWKSRHSFHRQLRKNAPFSPISLLIPHTIHQNLPLDGQWRLHFSFLKLRQDKLHYGAQIRFNAGVCHREMNPKGASKRSHSYELPMKRHTGSSMELIGPSGRCQKALDRCWSSGTTAELQAQAPEL